jgi:hypothetical protein
MQKTLSIVAVLSLLLNVALGYWVLTTEGNLTPSASVPGAAEFVPRASERFENTLLPQPPWKNIFGKSPQELASTLRLTGCPEKIVRNIVAGQINRRFEERKRAIRTIEDFWLTGDAKAAEELRRAQALVELEKERQGMIEQALQIPWYQDPGLEDRDAMLVYFTWFADSERAQRLANVFTKGRFEAAVLKATTARSQSPEARDKATTLVQWFNDEVRAVLTPDEYDELGIRFFEVGYFDVWKEQRRFGSKLSGPELREVLRILKPDQLIPLDLDNFDDQQKFSSEQNIEKGTKLREVLGDEPFAEFLRRHNGDLQSTPGWSDEGKPEARVFLELFELQQGTLAAAERIAHDATISEDDRDRMLADLVLQAEHAVEARIPPSYRSNYLGASWVETLGAAYAR